MEQRKRDLVGRGWAFPVKPTPGGRLRYLAGDEKIRQSIWIILSTAPGERQMLPAFGCGIHDLTFHANTVAFRGIVQEKIRDALLRFEPRIDVLDVRVDTRPEERNRVDIAIDYRVRSNNTLYNLVYPFFLTEGATRSP